MRSVAAYVVFKSVHDVMKMEAILKGTSLVFKLVPVPRKLSESCGISIKLDEDAVDEFERIAAAQGAGYEAIFVLLK